MMILASLFTAACLTPPPVLAHESNSRLPDGVSTRDWSQISSLITAERYRFHEAGVGHCAHNGDLRAVGTFEGRSGLIESQDGAWQFGLALTSYGFEGQMREVRRPEFGACSDGQGLHYGWTDEVSEWWTNDARGFEHGFHVWQRPAAGDRRGPLTFQMSVLGTLKAELNASRTGLALCDADDKVALRYDGLFATDARGVQLDAWLELRGDVLSIQVDESNAKYPLLIDPIVHEAYLKASNTDDGDGFGVSVSVSGDTMVVGAYGESSAATMVDGNQADNSAPVAGAAYVFVRTGGSWVQQAYLKASNAEAGDGFGVSASISGDTIVIGAPGEDSSAIGVNGDQTSNAASSAGAAYVFVRSGTSWSQQAYLKASNTDMRDFFGRSVSTAGDTIVVGARFEDSATTGVNGDGTDNTATSAGAAYVFVRTGGSWSQQAYLKASNADPEDGFGTSVSVSGDTIVVGAYDEDSAATGANGNEASNSAERSGAAYVFVRAGGAWSQQAYLKASNTDSEDLFGGAVSVSGDTIVVGAVIESSSATGVNGDESDNSGSFSGAAYVFVRTGSTWTQQAYLKASNTEIADSFGFSAVVSGDTIVIGAYREDSGATGVNGNQSDNSMDRSGAAYVFVRAGDVWTQQAYLKASNAEADDEFGRFVSVSGDTVVVGAYGEDSSATGVNGNQADNSGDATGAAYVFSGFTSPGLGDVICIGAENSTGFSGNLAATGSSAVADDSLSLQITCCPTTSFGLVVTTSANATPIQSVAVGQGTLCISTPQLGRFPAVVTDATGAATQPVDLAAVPTNQGPAVALPGDTLYFQFWHRDAIGGAATSNLTSAISVLLE